MRSFRGRTTHRVCSPGSVASLQRAAARRLRHPHQHASRRGGASASSAASRSQPRFWGPCRPGPPQPEKNRIPASIQGAIHVRERRRSSRCPLVDGKHTARPAVGGSGAAAPGGRGLPMKVASVSQRRSGQRRDEQVHRKTARFRGGDDPHAVPLLGDRFPGGHLFLGDGAAA